MSDEVNNIALIEEYIKGNLSGETLASFEKELAADSQLASEVALQTEIYNGIQRLGDKELLKELDTYHNDLNKRPTFSKRQKKAFFYSLGTALLIIVSLVTFTQMEGERGKKKLIEEETQVETTTNIDTDIVVDTTDSNNVVDTTTSESPIEVSSTIVPDENEIIEIKKFTNPIVLGKTSDKMEYTFSFGELKLYGADNIDLNRLEIIRHKNEILLYDQKYYCVLEETQKRKPLKIDPSIKIYNTYIKPGKSNPKMKIIKTNIELKEEIEFTSIRVIRKKGLTGNKYKFDKVTIEITEDFYKLLGDNFKLIHIDKMDHAIIKSDNGLYHLEKGTKDFVEVIKVHDPEIKALFNTEERLIPLKTETVEGFGSGHHPGN